MPEAFMYDTRTLTWHSWTKKKRYYHLGRPYGRWT